MTPIIDSFGPLVWTQFWQVTLVIAGVGLATRFTCRKRPHMAYVLGLVVLAKCLTPPLWGSPTGVFSWITPSSYLATEAEPMPDEAALLAAKDSSVAGFPAHENDQADPGVADTVPETISNTANPSMPPYEMTARPTETPAETLTDTFSESRLSHAVMLGIAWLAGVVIYTTAALVSAIRLCRTLAKHRVAQNASLTTLTADLARRLGIRRRVRLLVVDGPVGPMTYGWLRPTVVLPQALIDSRSIDEVEPLLAHELVHVRRGDALVGMVQFIVQCLWWFHPLVWWANRRIVCERERCCDEEVIAGLDYSPGLYARTLVAVLELKRQMRWAIALPGVRPFEITKQRLEHLMLHNHGFRPRMPRRCWVVLVVGVLLAVPGASFTRWDNRGVASPTVAEKPPTQKDAKPADALKEEAIAAATAPAASPQGKSSSESKKPTIKPVEVSCVNDQGAPVAGAEVHLFQRFPGDNGHYLHFGPFTSDEQGRVTCPKSVFTHESGSFDRWIYARVPGRFVGVARSTKWKNNAAINPVGRVELQISRSVEGKVSVPQGFELAKVTVRVQVLHVLTGPDDMDYQSFPREEHFPGLDTALPEIFECRPDAEGRIRLGDVPVRGRIFLVTRGDGLGEAQWRNDNNTFDQPIQLSIGVESSLAGRVLSPDGKPAVDMEVAARLSSHPQRPIRYLSTFRAVTNETGDFAIRGLPQTEFDLYVRDPKKRSTFRPLEDLSIQAETPRTMTLQMDAGVLVSGRVFDPEGKPVEGAHFSAVTDSVTGSGLAGDTTDANGRYQFRLPVGGARLYFNGLPDGFDYPNPPTVKTLDIKPGQADIEKLDFTIPRRPGGLIKADLPTDPSKPSPNSSQDSESQTTATASKEWSVKGRVVDHRGAPVADAEVLLLGDERIIVDADRTWFVVRTEKGQMPKPLSTRTDKDGKFSIVRGDGANRLAIISSDPLLWVVSRKKLAEGDTVEIKLPPAGSLAIDCDLPGKPAKQPVMIELRTFDGVDWNVDMVRFHFGNYTVKNPGKTVFEHLPPGRYAVQRNQETRTGEREFLITFADRQLVEVESNKRATVRIERKVGRPLAGQVQGLEKVDLRHAHVAIEYFGPEEELDQGGKRRRYATAFDVIPITSAGRFTTDPIPPGEYWLHLRAMRSTTSDQSPQQPDFVGQLHFTVPEKGDLPTLEIVAKPRRTDDGASAPSGTGGKTTGAAKADHPFFRGNVAARTAAADVRRG